MFIIKPLIWFLVDQPVVSGNVIGECDKLMMGWIIKRWLEIESILVLLDDSAFHMITTKFI